MTEVRLKDEQWHKIEEFLRATPEVYVGQEQACRRFVEGVQWLLRSGAQWRLLPNEYGRWNSVYKRFCRWSEQGVWEAMFEYFSEDPDMESVMLDSSVIRAHACAAGATHKKGGQDEQALGYSQGGFSTKVHVTVDALGNPLRVHLTPGQAHEAPHAEALLKDYRAEFVLADKGYDAEHVRTTIRELGAEPVIPPRANRLNPSEYDAERYQERHLIKCFFSKLKHFRRCFSRFDKLARHYLSFLYFASTLIWLR